MREFLRAHWARVLASVLLFAVFFGNQGFRSLVSNWLELRRLKAELAELSRQDQLLSERLHGIRGGDAGLERLARRELGFVRPGEIEYRFPPPDPGR